MTFRPYDHPATEYDAHGHRECRICGFPVTGIGQTLRHRGEAIRPTVPAREDAPAFRDAYTVVEAALGEVFAPGTSDADRARVAVEALYRAGALQCRRARWKRPLTTA